MLLKANAYSKIGIEPITYPCRLFCLNFVCLWSGLSLNHIEFCARLMCIVIDGCFLLLRVPIFHHEDYYFPTSMSVHTHLSFNLGSLRKVSTHCLTNVTVPYIFNAYLRTTFRITLARDWHIYISTI